MDQEHSRHEDEDLVTRTQTGDSAAFDALILKYSPRLYALIYNMTGNRDDTDDMLQEVWAKAFRAIGGFRGKSKFYTWIYTIATNSTMSFLEKRSYRKTLSLDDADNGVLEDRVFAEFQDSRTPVREADLAEMQQKITGALMKLSPQHRAVVVMSDIQEMPHADIARILGVGEGTVRSRLHYAHQYLQNWLSEFAPTHST